MRIGGGAVSIADVTDRTARDLGFVRPFWLNEIRAGRAFAGTIRQAPVVGQFSQCQLINPAASGIIVIVRRATGSLGADGVLRMTSHNTELTTDGGTAVNLLSGGAASIAHLRSQALGESGTEMGNFKLLAIVPYDAGKDWIMELGEAEGLLLGHRSANNEIDAYFEWIEVAP